MRLVLAGLEYRKLRLRVFARQGWKCLWCGKTISAQTGELHHSKGRGLGGGFRDDSQAIGLCRQCHDSLKGGHELSRFGVRK